MHKLPNLKYEKNSLEPYMSKETFDYHYGKHHQIYITNLNNLIKGTDQENLSLEVLIRSTKGGVYNNAAQHWNHSFFWKCLMPKSESFPECPLKNAIISKFGSIQNFKQEFVKQAVGNFGSGWTWLVKKPDGTVDIVNTSNADSPLTTQNIPLFTIDVWEHAYYIDYKNGRQKFVQSILDHISNWNFANQNFVENPKL